MKYFIPTIVVLFFVAMALIGVATRADSREEPEFQVAAESVVFQDAPDTFTLDVPLQIQMDMPNSFYMSRSARYRNFTESSYDYMLPNSRTGRDDTREQFRESVLERLPTMCLAAPIDFEGGWAFGCLVHF